jgi:hypothetical protein
MRTEGLNPDGSLEVTSLIEQILSPNKNNYAFSHSCLNFSAKSGVAPTIDAQFQSRSEHGGGDSSRPTQRS